MQPAGLSTKAFYDSDTNTFTTPDPYGVTADYYYYDETLSNYIQRGSPGFRWWYSNPVANSYFTEPDAFNDPANDVFRIESVNKSVEFKRSRLDGITLELDPTKYAQIVSAGLDNFGVYNESGAALYDKLS